MVKKLMSIMLTVILIYSFIVPCLAKTIREETQEQEYDLSLILVMIKKEYSEFGKEYTPADFDEELIKSVRVINQIIPGETDLSCYDLEYWQQTLELYLKEPCAENVEKAINAAYKNPQVQVASKNYTVKTKSPEKLNTSQENVSETEKTDLYSTNSALSATSESKKIGIYPNDNRNDEQYALRLIRAHRAWAFTTGNSSVKIGVIDSGIDVHMDLKYDSTLSKNFTDEIGLNDRTGHGTHVAGIIQAQTNNIIGVSGVCWNGSLVILKVLKRYEDGTSGGDVSWTINAINYAITKGIRVLNISIEFDEDINEKTLELFTSAVNSFNGIIVCCAGNIDEAGETADSIQHPSLTQNFKIISVASCDINFNIASGSKFSLGHVDIAAPGVAILSTVNHIDYEERSGTSMAAPFVTGTVALLLSINPNYTPLQLKAFIIGASDLRNIDFNGEEIDILYLNTLNSVLAALGYAGVGDVDMNGSITAADARLALQFSSQIETYNDQEAVLTDINYDNLITAEDARTILNMAAQLASEPEQEVVI